jgi:hypothetical protein
MIKGFGSHGGQKIIFFVFKPLVKTTSTFFNKNFRNDFERTALEARAVRLKLVFWVNFLAHFFRKLKASSTNWLIWMISSRPCLVNVLSRICQIRNHHNLNRLFFNLEQIHRKLNFPCNVFTEKLFISERKKISKIWYLLAEWFYREKPKIFFDRYYYRYRHTQNFQKI